MVAPQVASAMEGAHPNSSELADFVAGQLQDDQTSAWIEFHLSECQACCDTAVALGPDRFEARLGQLARVPEREEGPVDRLGPGYELLEVIGRGGSGVVYRARQAGLEREVAFKTLLAGANASPQQFARFRQESLALSRVHHPHVVEIYDIGDQGGSPFLAMEFVRGKTLAEFMHSGPLEVKEAVDLMIQLADAVQCVHRQGILHRDLKPQNILLEEGSTRKAKLADFGLSHLSAAGLSITNSGDPLGTPGYMAPEMVSGDKRAVGVRSDIYSLGAILYECLAGRPPFRCASAVETMKHVLQRDPLPLEQLRAGIPKDLQTICQCALEKDPSRRYATAAAMRDDLTAFQQHRPITTRPRSVPYRAQLWIRRYPWPATWLATVVVAVMVGLVSLLVHQGRIVEQRDRANQQYADARAAIWSILHAANQSNSFQIPKLGELTLSQAQHALQLFEKLAAEDNSIDAQRDLARIRMHVGTLRVTFGESEKGGELLARASADLRRLTSGAPQSVDDDVELIALQTNLAISLDNQRRFKDAMQIIKLALELAEHALATNPDNIHLLEGVARLYHEKGNWFFYHGRIDQMKQCLRKAVACRKRALAIAPYNRTLIQRLTESRVNLAQAECQDGQLDASERDFRAAIDALQSLSSPRNPDISVLVSLATARLDLSNVLAGRQQLQSAVDCCSEGIAEIESVLKVEPHQAAARLICCQLHGNRAIYRTSLQQSAEAFDDWETAVELADGHDVKAYCRVMKVRCLIKSGELAAAETESASLDVTLLDPANHFRIAAMWGLLGNALHQQANGNGEVADRANGYYARAAALVVELNQEGGYLRNHPADAQYVEQSDDFREVRIQLSPQQIKLLVSASAPKKQREPPEAEIRPKQALEPSAHRPQK